MDPSHLNLGSSHLADSRGCCGEFKHNSENREIGELPQQLVMEWYEMSDNR